MVDKLFVSEMLFRLDRCHNPLFKVIEGLAIWGWFVARAAVLALLFKSHAPLHPLDIQLREGKRRRNIVMRWLVRVSKNGSDKGEKTHSPPKHSLEAFRPWLVPPSRS